MPRHQKAVWKELRGLWPPARFQTRTLSAASAPRPVKRHSSTDAAGPHLLQQRPSDVWGVFGTGQHKRDALRRRLAASWKYHPRGGQPDRHAIELAASKLLKKPEKAAEVLAKLNPEDRRAVALAWAMTELEEEFIKADTDHDGKLSYKEFKDWAIRTIQCGPKRDEVTPPTNRQLAYVSLGALVPFIGFGMVDNGLMVIYGDVIDGTLGVMFGFSMLASAALGNAISNIFGMILHGTIHKWADKLGIPDPHLTLAQRKLPRVHFWTTFGSTVGVFTGCLLGMGPLLFMDQTKKEEERAATKLPGAGTS